MKIIYGVVALLGVINAAANTVKDLGEGTWWISKGDWYKYYHLKNGKQIFFEGCKFRIGSLDQGRDNAKGSIKWSVTDSGDRQLSFKRDNARSKWINFTKYDDGSYRAGRPDREWKIWNKSGAVNFSGAIGDCAKKTVKFKTAVKQWAKAADSVSSSSSFEKCGQSVQDDCKDTTVEMTEDGWKLATAQLTDSATFLITATSQAMASDMSFTLKRATNSLKCAVTNIGNNAWNLFGMVWYLSLETGYSAEVTKYVAEYYPYVCTCQMEVTALSELFGGDESTASIMGACSEKGQAEVSDQKEIKNGGLPEEDDTE